ncbi:MAG TPA: hypothetical protein VFP15_03985 [Gemmatimonadaceae bacterium]|nr:hypothetical protein [Gemmatimonadaceae bacterium]
MRQQIGQWRISLLLQEICRHACSGCDTHLFIVVTTPQWLKDRCSTAGAWHADANCRLHATKSVAGSPQSLPDIQFGAGAGGLVQTRKLMSRNVLRNTQRIPARG